MAGNSTPRAFFGNARALDAALCLAIVLFVVVAKLPGILCPIELGIDESQLLVQAMRYSHDLVPWRSVDGTTSGPLNSWFPLATSYLGIPLNYHGAHLLGALLSAAIIVFSYLALRVVVEFWLAALVAAVGVVTIVSSASWDFLQLTTEQLPAALLAGAAWIWLRETGRERPRLLQFMLAGALVGAVPWAKLQGLPIAAAFGAVFLCQLWTGDADRSATRKILPLLGVAGAAMAPGLIILLPMALAGAFPDFWQSYIVGVLGYAGAPEPGVRLARAYALATASPLRLPLALIGLAALVLTWRRSHVRPETSRGERSLFRIGALGSVGAIFACLRPATHFAHYQFWLIGPVLLLTGALLQRVGQASRHRARWRRVSIGTAAGVILWHGAAMQSEWRESRAQVAEFTRAAAASPQRVLAGALHQLSPGARTMVIWGWMPALYLESGLTCATRHAIGHFLIDPLPSRDFLRRSYLADLRQNRPDMFVDAVASGCFTWFWDVKTSGMESFPELSAYINEHYELAGQSSPAAGGTPLRIFRRKER